MKRFFILGSHSPSLRNFRGPLIEAMQLRGYEVDAAAPGLTADKPTQDWLHDRGVKTHEVALSRTGLNPTTDLKTLFQLRRLMRRLGPEIFFGYTIKPVVWGTIAAWLAGTPHRVALIPGLGYAFTGEARGRRAVIQYIVRMLYGFALRRATLILFQNDDDQNDFERLGLLPAATPVVVVNGSGVDTDHFSPVPFPEGPVKFLLIARLLGDKGIREYVRAAEELRKAWPDAEFHLVGGLDSNPDSISEDEVRSWHDRGFVTWFGVINDVRPAITAAHVYVLPSYREGTSRTVLEAMAMGRPVITTDAPGCRQTLETGVNGYLVKVADTASLKQAMEIFLKDPALISSMGRASRRIAEEKYDVHKVNDAIMTAIGI